MAMTKKVFIGSLFEFTRLGAEEVLHGFRGQYADPETVPFVSYDVNRKLFSCEVDPSDHNLVVLLNAQIDTYTTLHGRKPNEPFELDRLVQIDGTTFRSDVYPTQQRDLEPHLLFDVDDSSDEEVDERPEASTRIYWQPKGKDMSILSSEIAAEIADMTRAVLIPDQVRQRVQLNHGNLHAALEKLQKVEDVLALITRHRLQDSSHANTNILLFNSGPESTLRFVRPDPKHLGFERIMFDPSQLSLLSQVVLGELRIWQQTQRMRPPNLSLEEVSLTTSIGLSHFLGQPNMPVIGTAKSAEPRPPSKDHSQTSGEIQRPGSPTKFLGQRETERVEEWRGNIDPEAMPTLPPEQPAPDDEKKPSRRRLVDDSSSDDEAVVKNFAKKAPIKNNLQKEIASPSSIEINTTKDTAGKGSSTSFAIRSAMVSKTKHAKSPKNLTKTNNMFDLIQADEDAEDESSSESTMSNQSQKNVKRHNVTFEESRSQPNKSPNPGLSALARGFEARTHNGFDVLSEGLKSHTLKHDSSVGNAYPDFSHGGTLKTESSPSRAVPGVTPLDQVPPTPRGPRRREQRSAYDDRGHVPSSYRPRDLIDVSTDANAPNAVMPPPGFDYRSSDLPNSSGSLQASPQHLIQPQSQSQFQFQSHTRSEAQIAGQSSVMPPVAPALADPRYHMTDFTPQLVVPRRDINFLKGQALAKLEKQMKPDKPQKKKGGKNSNKDDSRPNQIQENDESRSRVFHKTMSQNMAKPGKGKKASQTQESKAEREARIMKVKAEAYGDTVTAKSRLPELPANTRSDATASNMSAKKRSIFKKNAAMAELHQEVIADTSNKHVAYKLVEALKPILQATRAFKGVIKVEIQLGQALIIKSNRVDEGRLYTPKDWIQLLNEEGQSNTNVAFTNILTTNGRDIDRMLEIKAESNSSKLWNRGQPETITTRFEFTCEDKSGCTFILCIDQNGGCSLNNIESTIGKIVIHAPGQIWDAAAVVSGTMKRLRPTEELLTGVEQFRENLYVPGGKKAAVYYRLPSNNAFTIKAIMVKRVSVHDSLVPGRSDVQLRVTEVKDLAHSSNPTDKKLFRSYESDYEVMIRENRIHYQVAIIDKFVEEVFSKNPDIELGELAPVDIPDGHILNSTRALNLVQTTSYMLSHIDWAGAYNIGTLKRLASAEVDRNNTLVNAFPPNLNYNLPVPMGQTAPPTITPTGYQSNYSRIAGTVTGTNVAIQETVFRPLHGVRANTAAELFRDSATGELFYYGQGGARVPVVNDQLEGVRYDGLGPVLPADSASQVGDARMRTVQAQSNRGRGAVNDVKPPGYW